jgi:anti-anti-sigma factor
VKVARTKEGEIHVLRLSGEFDSFDAQSLGEAVEICLREEKPRLLLDLGEVTFANSTAIACFLNAQRSARTKGGALAVARPNLALRKTLRTLGLEQVVPVFDSREKASSFLLGS